MGKFSGAGQSGLVGHLCFERIGCKCVMLNLWEKRKTVQVGEATTQKTQGPTGTSLVHKSKMSVYLGANCERAC